MDVKLLKWIFTVLTVVVIIKSVFLVYYEIHTILRDEITNNFLQMQCLRLRQKYSNITSAARSDIKSFSKDLSDLMSCPHMSDITHKELNRVRLRFCCNATGVLYLTKKNTAVDQSIPYETSKHSYKMNAALHRMLPKDFPWSGHHLNRCAVVGSGGILKNSRCGREIDSADYVIRFNMAPINNSDVGIKTDLLTINPSQLSAGYKNMRDNPGPLVQRVSAYGNASLIIPAFAYSYFTQLSINTLKVLYSARSQQRVVFFSSYYLKTLGHFWKKHGLKEIRLSTGFMLINVALEVCDHVHIYGFWPFDVNLEQKPVLHHYYDNKGPKRGVHSMPEEFLRLLQLHSQGALTLHLLPCT